MPKTRFSAADYWITKAQPWFSALTGAPLPQQAIIAGAPSTDSTAQIAWSVAPCSWPSRESEEQSSQELRVHMSFLGQPEQFDFLQISYALDDRGVADRDLPKGVAVICNRPFGGGDLLQF